MQIEDLPNEILYKILTYIDAKTLILGLSCTCWRLRRIACSSMLWQRKFQCTFKQRPKAIRCERRLMRCVKAAESVKPLLTQQSQLAQPNAAVQTDSGMPVLAHVLSGPVREKTLLFVTACQPTTVNMLAEPIFWRYDAVTLGFYELDRAEQCCKQVHVATSQAVVYSVAEDSASRRFFAACEGLVQCWDVRTFATLSPLHFDNDLSRIRFWNDRGCLAATFCSNDQRNLCFIDSRSNVCNYWSNSSFGALTDFAPIDDNYFVVASVQGLLHVADMRTQRAMGHLQLRPQGPCVFDLNSDLAFCYALTSSNELKMLKVNHRLGESENLLELIESNKLNFTERVIHVQATNGSVFVSDLSGSTTIVNPFRMSDTVTLPGDAAVPAFKPNHFAGDTHVRISNQNVLVWYPSTPN